jgi:hypothetical protein
MTWDGPFVLSRGQSFHRFHGDTATDARASSANSAIGEQGVEHESRDQPDVHKKVRDRLFPRRA